MHFFQKTIVGEIWISVSTEGQGHLATLARVHLDCMSLDTPKDIFSKTAGPISIKFHVQRPDNRGKQ